jgi:hypothetical protein
MLEIIDKISVWIAVVTFGYLVYTSMEQTGLVIDSEKELPEITKEMISPKLIEPTDHVSPVGRDPFEVDWATYFDISQITGDTGTTQTTAGQQAGLPFSKRLMGIITARNGQNAALIEGKVYQVGSLIDGTNPSTCWKVEAIKKNEVIITLGEDRKILNISRDIIQDNTTESDIPKEAEQ